MKIIVFLSILFYSFLIFGAENWFPAGKTEAKTVYMNRGKCESVEGQKCFDITNKAEPYYTVKNVDDETNPIFRDPNSSSVKLDCNGPSDCAEKSITKDGEGVATGNVCDGDGGQPRIDKLENWPGVTGLAGPWFIWCQQVVGFQQKEALVEDASLKAAYEAEQAAAQAKQDLLAQAKKDIVYGERLLLELIADIKSKKLGKGARKKAVSDLAPIVELLKMGSIDVAKDEIAALTPDGTVITQAKIDAIVQRLTDDGY